jgi:general stress protein 26
VRLSRKRRSAEDPPLERKRAGRIAVELASGVDLRARDPTLKAEGPMPGNADDDRKRLEELIGHFHAAMLVTHGEDGSLRARPLSLAKTHDDGVLFFATSIASPKVAELERTPTVAVTLQDSRRYVSISGTARVTQDRALIDRLWSETWRLWFPKGKEDPDLCIVEVTPRQAEYWDQSGLAGVKFILEAAKAYATGTKPESGESGDHAKIQI